MICANWENPLNERKFTAEIFFAAIAKIQTMTKLAAILCSVYCLAGVALFLTGKSPVFTDSTDFFGDTFAYVWSGWKFSGLLYMTLINFGVGLGPSAAISMVPYIAFDVLAGLDEAHWTPLAWSFVVLEALTAAFALRGSYKFGGVVNALYCLAGLALFLTNEAPVVAPGVDFFGNTFAVAWAGWKFSGCFYFALVNLGTDANLAMALTMVPYVIFDVYAYMDSAHWTPLAASFIVLDGAMGALGLKAYLEAPEALKAE